MTNTEETVTEKSLPSVGDTEMLPGQLIAGGVVSNMICTLHPVERYMLTLSFTVALMYSGHVVTGTLVSEML